MSSSNSMPVDFFFHLLFLIFNFPSFLLVIFYKLVALVIQKNDYISENPENLMSKITSKSYKFNE